MSDITKKYTNGEVTVVWKPAMCIHSTICWKEATGITTVFNPRVRPWINPLGATTDDIIAQVDKCPSGALSYFMNNEEGHEQEHVTGESIVETIPNGPLMVYGNLTIKGRDGSETKKDKVTAFCRCGASQNKPYCDGSHIKAGFKDE